eukprot:m51a1_g2807 putative minor histocompatibility protein ha-1 isoform x4 (728) ;mRNA; f:120033-123097
MQAMMGLSLKKKESQSLTLQLRPTSGLYLKIVFSEAGITKCEYYDTGAELKSLFNSKHHLSDIDDYGLFIPAKVAGDPEEVMEDEEPISMYDLSNMSSLILRRRASALRVEAAALDQTQQPPPSSSSLTSTSSQAHAGAAVQTSSPVLAPSSPARGAAGSPASSASPTGSAPSSPSIHRMQKPDKRMSLSVGKWFRGGGQQGQQQGDGQAAAGSPGDARRSTQYSSYVREVEDSDPASRVGKIQNLLKFFLKYRATPEELVQRHILVERPTTIVPFSFDAMRRSLDWIADTNLDTEGIFRVSAPAPETNALIQTLVSGEIVFDQPEQETSPHAVTTALKLYMRERTNPLIPYKEYKALNDQLAGVEEGSARMQELCGDLVRAVAEDNRAALGYLLAFLAAVTEHSGENKMIPRNLAVVFGPALLRTEMTGMDSLWETESQVRVIESLINHYKLLQSEGTAPSYETLRKLADFAAIKDAINAVRWPCSPGSAELPAPSKPAATDSAAAPQQHEQQQSSLGATAPASGAQSPAGGVMSPRQSWMRPGFSEEQVRSMLAGSPTGTYLVSTTPAGDAFLVYHVMSHGQLNSFLVWQQASGKCQKDGDDFVFDSMESIIKHYEDAGYFVAPYRGKPTEAPAAPLTHELVLSAAPPAVAAGEQEAASGQGSELEELLDDLGSGAGDKALLAQRLCELMEADVAAASQLLSKQPRQKLAAAIWAIGMATAGSTS